MNNPSQTRIRADKWLWAARFFKTRALAAQALSGGHVHINGERSKPAHTIKIGDVLKITKAGSTYIVSVSALAERRANASAAQRLYVEDPTSQAQREHQRLMYRLNAMSNPRPEKRPDKRERRQLKAWREQS